MTGGSRGSDVPPGIPAGVLDPARLQRIVDELAEAPLDLANWAALKAHLLAAWPRDPWAHRSAECTHVWRDTWDPDVGLSGVECVCER